MKRWFYSKEILFCKHFVLIRKPTYINSISKTGQWIPFSFLLLHTTMQAHAFELSSRPCLINSGNHESEPTAQRVLIIVNQFLWQTRYQIRIQVLTLESWILSPRCTNSRLCLCFTEPFKNFTFKIKIHTNKTKTHSNLFMHKHMVSSRNFNYVQSYVYIQMYKRLCKVLVGRSTQNEFLIKFWLQNTAGSS